MMSFAWSVTDLTGRKEVVVAEAVAVAIVKI